jgi:hypothetical protein
MLVDEMLLVEILAIFMLPVEIEAAYKLEADIIVKLLGVVLTVLKEIEPDEDAEIVTLSPKCIVFPER